MIRLANEMKSEKREQMRGGEGTAVVTPALISGDYQSDLKMFSHITLPVGASIGYHIHQGEEELFYFLSGTAELNDNGTLSFVKAGDAAAVCSGQGHAVRNCGNEPLEIFAVIAKVKE